MESKESARLKEIKDGLNKIDLHLKEQNQQLKSIAASLSAIHDRIVEFKKAHNMDVFDKQWHGDVNAIDKIVARRTCSMDISQEEQNELQ